MTFVNPLALLWLTLLIPVVLLHMLKKKRRELKVSSTFLWQGALRDVNADQPFRRLIPRVSLLLQILAVIAGTFAIAKPQLGALSKPGERLCVIIDTSSSMLARSADMTRLDEAKAAVASLVSGLAPGSEVMLIAAGETPEIRSAFERDEHALERALDSVEIRGNETAIMEAVSLATARLEGDGRIIVYTDGVFEGSIPAAGDVQVEYRMVGPTEANAGITEARARRDGTNAALFVVITYAGSTEDTDAFVQVRASPGGPIVASRRVRLSPARDTPFRMRVPLQGIGANDDLRLYVSLTFEDNRRDAIDEDNLVVVAASSDTLPVVLYGDTNPYLRRALQLDPHVDLFRATQPLSEGIEAAVLARRPLFIFSGEVPAVPPPGDSVVIAPPEGEAFEATIGEEVEAPRIISWVESDDRTRFLRLDEIPLGKSRQLLGTTPLIRGLDGPVAGTVTRPTGETLFVAFDLGDGRWPTDPSFVVFFRNVIERARIRRGAGGLGSAALGQPIQVQVPEGQMATVVTPSGQRFETESQTAQQGAQNTLATVRLPIPPEAGAFVVTTGAETLIATRALLSRSESRLERQNLDEVDAEVGQAEASPDNLWWFFALLLVALFVLELFWETRKAGFSFAPKRERS